MPFRPEFDKGIIEINSDAAHADNHTLSVHCTMELMIASYLLYNVSTVWKAKDCVLYTFCDNWRGILCTEPGIAMGEARR